MKRALILLLLLAGLSLLPTPAMALSCHARIDTFSFGADVTPAGSDTSSVLHWECERDDTPGDLPLNIRMCLFIGTGTRPAVNPRVMVRSAAPNILINYDLFADSARSQIVGPEGSASPFSFTLQLPAGDYYEQGTVPIYGRIYPGQNMLPFQYADESLPIEPVYASYNVSADAPSVTECLGGLADGYAKPTFTDVFDVQAQVANTCFIGTATDLEFGQVDTLDRPRDQNTTITLHCPFRTSWQVGLNDGLNAGAGGIRRMARPGGAQITYELYRDSGRTQRWGNTLNSDTVTGEGDGNLRPLIVYGRVPTQPTPAGGTYSDTITVTLTF